jgi:hypothetical protein
MNLTSQTIEQDTNKPNNMETMQNRGSMLERYLADKYNKHQQFISAKPPPVLVPPESDIEGPHDRMTTLNAYESGASFMPHMQTELDDPSTTNLRPPLKPP